ncbi:hypothetical protein E2C01_092537 [Portunus trituberculatus]|uniref:Uncharacterized protein n=1 Tax=Portunus trituberculatus TaxID=210409 RepID=A0A5B7JS01_PORTR|nr:hypothetical protein [Portunus trituberculatus]
MRAGEGKEGLKGGSAAEGDQKGARDYGRTGVRAWGDCRVREAQHGILGNASTSPLHYLRNSKRKNDTFPAQKWRYTRDISESHAEERKDEAWHSG